MSARAHLSPAPGELHPPPATRAAAAMLAVVVAFGFVAGIFPISDGDLFWHLAAGRWIVEHGRVPDTDPFRFTAAGAPWVDHEWLFQVALFALERLGGLAGLFWLRAAALAALAALVFRLASRATLPPGLAALLTLFGVLGVRPRFLLRPEMVTLFALLLLLGALERWRERPTSTTAPRSLFGMAALVVVWVNLHGEALLAPGLVFLFLLGDALGEGGARGALAAWRRIVLPPAAGALLLLANPYGARLIEVPLGIRHALADLPAVNPEWMSALRAPQPYLFGGLAVTLALAVVARRRTGRWPAPEWGLPAAAMAVVALSAVRHQALFFAVAVPFASRALAALPEIAAAPARPRRSLAGVAALSAIALALWCVVPPASGPLSPRHGGLAGGVGLDPRRFPVGLVDKLATRPAIGPLYNELVHGGYLLWRTYPPRQVFVDGRMELDPELLHEIGRARGDGAAWRALLARERIVGALVPHDPRRVPVLEGTPGGALVPVGEAPILALLFPSEEWALVDWDDAALLFLLRDEAERRWPEPPYRYLTPHDPERMVARARASPEFRAAALAELERKRREAPASARVGELAARLAGAR